MTDLEIALKEMQETVADMDAMRLSPEFEKQLDRIRLDMCASPHVALTENMCKWVILAYKRSESK